MYELTHANWGGLCLKIVKMYRNNPQMYKDRVWVGSNQWALSFAACAPANFYSLLSNIKNIEQIIQKTGCALLA